MLRKSLGIIFTFVLMCFILQGCTQSSESDAAKNANTNQAVKVSNVTNENNIVNASNISETNNNLAPSINSAPAVNKKPMSKGTDPQPNIGSGGDDLAILLQARNKLSSDKDLINSVIVEVKQGNATLSGKVSNDEQKKKAEQLVEGVQGIKSIKNNLRVSP